ncbi:DUF1405 domain-containing protein [Candidatus Nanohalococcus occultus]|uniref:Uncharacterized membrane protein, DUF1405 family n=1 Tax=Candidatus Nanohalococcus occultus TaxID=2978047 RepID=A0ABY8CDQ8_9ARCH|nr:Uncharacterized membrane protein, DUF1405 family [Candidatus Nanohaloarchaeota archaeon SVXNc]
MKAPSELFFKLREYVLTTRLWILLVAVNLVGTAYGFYFYGDQLRETSVLLWIFVADSPLSTLGIAAAVTLRKIGRQNKYVDAYAFLANLKYGLWTAIVLLIYFRGFTSINSTGMYLFLFFSHLGMAVQAFLIEDIDLKALAGVGGFFIVNDFFDYVFGVHPFIPSDNIVYAGLTAVSLTLIGLLVAWKNKDGK